MSEPAYLQLDPDVEQAIAENLRCGRMHPRSFPDEQALRREDNPHDAATLAPPGVLTRYRQDHEHSRI